ncbi:hypothetical protein M6B38_395815 [Iris pallida]|uniref:Uncharacterized protein n=1 Tax=Iris pallida TaxID=29817 RepID=A0AAX6E8L5_IRIPA|nr:hypothetical protein M6B38_202920 [Iris pallida]KAJ6820751.1 hypothetical protein M6B38_395815 [Iris pallida]
MSSFESSCKGSSSKDDVHFLVLFAESWDWERKVITFLYLGAKGIEEERKVISNGKEIRGKMVPSIQARTHFPTFFPPSSIHFSFQFSWYFQRPERKIDGNCNFPKERKRQGIDFLSSPFREPNKARAPISCNIFMLVRRRASLILEH